MQQRAQPGKQPSLLVAEHQLQQPLQHFMLPHLTAAMRISLRATCKALHALVDADAASWARAGYIEPELVAQPLNASQIQGNLVRQGRALARMRSGQPKECFVLPCSSDNWQLEGNWSKCTANGSQFFTVFCLEAGSQNFNAILDVFNGRLHRLIFPREDGEDVSQWLDERRLLTWGWKHGSQVTCITEAGIVPLWSSKTGDFLHKPVLTAATPPALPWVLKGQNKNMHLFSTSDYSAAELPSACSSNLKVKVREMSWSPDKSHLALTFIQADHSRRPGRMLWDNYVVSIHKIVQGISICHGEQPGFCKALWSPAGSLALWSSQTGKIMIMNPHSSLQTLDYLATIDAVINWAYSPDNTLLAVCCQAECTLPEDLDLSSDDSTAGSATYCFY